LLINSLSTVHPSVSHISKKEAHVVATLRLQRNSRLNSNVASLQPNARQLR